MGQAFVFHGIACCVALLYCQPLGSETTILCPCLYLFNNLLFPDFYSAFWFLWVRFIKKVSTFYEKVSTFLNKGCAFM